MAVATYDQVRFAQAFLRSVGANWRDNYLILVVVAWIVAANRGWSRIRGNNPFLVRTTAVDARYRIGTFKINGITYSRYASFDVALAATVLTLRRGANADQFTHFQRILDAFRAAKGYKGAQAVAYALSNSTWDYSSHYLTSRGKNLILVVMSRFTGLQLTPPVKPPPKRPPPKPTKNFPTPGRYPIPETHHKWPVPTAPLSFLRERQWVAPIWTSRKV